MCRQVSRREYSQEDPPIKLKHKILKTKISLTTDIHEVRVERNFREILYLISYSNTHKHKHTQKQTHTKTYTHKHTHTQTHAHTTHIDTHIRIYVWESLCLLRQYRQHLSCSKTKWGYVLNLKSKELSLPCRSQNSRNKIYNSVKYHYCHLSHNPPGLFNVGRCCMRANIKINES